jgi:hypothetical protein
MQTLDLFKLGDTATWEIEVELKDTQCRRDDFIIPLTEELAMEAIEADIYGPLLTRIRYHLLDTPYRLKYAGEAIKR